MDQSHELYCRDFQERGDAMNCVRPAILLVAGLLLAPVTQSNDVALESIKTLRLQGKLEVAQTKAEQELTNATCPTKVAYHLELARIHDRIGLHQNTRPVLAALQHIELAEESAAECPTGATNVSIEFALAEFHYRAEMQEREFLIATAHAELAAQNYRELDNRHGEADAIHLLGLIALQKRDLSQARILFDQSLALDLQGGARTLFRGDYERHVGFVLYMQEHVPESLPYFERSLQARRDAGAIDASMFAAVSLGSLLVELEQLREAKIHLLFALIVGELLQSPAGVSRAGINLGELYAKEGDRQSARLALEMTIGVAETVGLISTVQQAQDVLADL
jgi:tetratricopeptide (TPR) repeat protein